MIKYEADAVGVDDGVGHVQDDRHDETEHGAPRCQRGHLHGEGDDETNGDEQEHLSDVNDEDGTPVGEGIDTGEAELSFDSRLEVTGGRETHICTLCKGLYAYTRQ